MIRPTRLRRFAPLALGLVLGLGLATTPAPARAQEEGMPPAEGAEGEEKGRPFDGYFVTGLFAFATLFAVGKSARR